ncbi:MAG: serine--tRNA ligase, partial [Armatimonadota bacterium]|nr:serine--tRNA ligase [Armatimonadota bacterium]
MLDLKSIRNNPDLVKTHLADKHIENGAAMIDEVLRLDERRRALLWEVGILKRRRNENSQEVARKKKSGEDTNDLIARTRLIVEQIGGLDAEWRDVEDRVDRILLEIPNLHHPEVPVGAGEEDNVEVARWGEPPPFDFAPRAHWEVGEKLGIIDSERGAKISGSRFYTLRGAGARLE